MDRRLAGALLVMVAVVAAIVVPARAGVRVQGQAVAAALPDEPQIGECLVDRRSIPAETTIGEPIRLHPEVVGAGLDVSRRMVFGPCGPSSAGEVVAVSGGHDGPALYGGSTPDCRAAALQYAGLTATEDRLVPIGLALEGPVDWHFSVDLRQTWMMPAWVLRAAGQQWRACVVAPVSGRSYAGTLAGAFAGGTLPDEFSLCWAADRVSAAMKRIDCDRPHRSELIATGTINDANTTTPQHVRDSCQEAARTAMRRADPSAGGGLSVQTNPDFGDSISPRLSPINVVCFIAASDRLLSGSVIGLGDRAIPYSG